MNDLLSRAQHLKDLAERTIYVLRGQQPRSPGYTAFKQHAIARALGQPFDPARLAPGWGWRLDERIVEYPWLFARLPDGPGELLDAGSILNFDFILDQPKLRQKHITIVTLAPEANCYHQRRVSYLYEDLRATCLRDAHFDLVVSVSTLEHVGMDNTMFYTADATKREQSPTAYLEAMRELRRVLKPGGRLLLTLPFGRHANHGWLQVFDAPMLDAAIEAFQPAQLVEDHYRYEPDGWRISSRAGSQNGTYPEYFRTGRYDADFQVGARAVACLELVR